MKQIIRRILNKFNYDVIRIDPYQIGQDYLFDIGRFVHNDHPVVFDVGANVGQSVRKFRKKFPQSTIHSFEPGPVTFKKLQKNVPESANAHVWNLALGPSSGQMKFFENSHSDMSSFLPLGDFGWGTVTQETLVEVKTIDRFCDDENIERIDILKSDTQGFDLEVFKGAEQTIRANKVGLIFFEVIFSEMYKNLPSFAETYDFLTSRGFLLVSFYKFRYQKLLAAWTNALFIHNSYIRDDIRNMDIVPYKAFTGSNR